MLEHLLGAVDAHPLQVVARRHAGDLAEAAQEGALAHRGAGRQLGHGQIALEVLAHVGDGALDGLVARRGEMLGAQMHGLGGGTRIDQHDAGAGIGHPVSHLGADELQADVAPGGCGCAAQDAAVLGDDFARLQVDHGIAPPERLGQPPAGGGAAPVEQLGLGQNEGAAADPAQALALGVPQPQPLDVLIGNRRDMRHDVAPRAVVEARQHDDVGVTGRAVAGVHRQHEPRRAAHRLAVQRYHRPREAPLGREPGDVGLDIGDVEHLDGTGDAGRHDIIECEYRHIWHKSHRVVGVIRIKIVYNATSGKPRRSAA